MPITVDNFHLHDKKELLRRLNSRQDQMTFWRRSKASRKKSSLALELKLGPHGTDYFAPMKPVFLHHFDDSEVMSFFSPLMIRDGLHSLSHFFFHHPRPWNEDLFLLIEHQLAPLIPPTWEPQTALYQIQARQNLIERDELIFLFSPAHSTAAASRHWASEIARAKTVASSLKKSLKIKCCILLHERLEKPQEQLTLPRLMFEAFSLLQQNFGSAVSVINFNELMNTNLSRSYFLDINPTYFHYSDSSVVHQMLRKGATPLWEGPPMTEPLWCEPLSFHHQVQVTQTSSDPSLHEKKLFVQTQFENFRSSSLLMSEEKLYAAQNENEQFCSPSFSSLAEELQEHMYVRSNQ